MSPSFIVPPCDWNKDNIHTVGYFFPRFEFSTDKLSIDEKLLSFLESGPPPIYIGFGSIPIPYEESEQFLSCDCDLSKLLFAESSDDDRLFCTNRFLR